MKNNTSAGLTLVINDHVAIKDQERYEQKVDTLHQLFDSHSGFLSADIVRFSREDQIEYTVLLRFSDQTAASKWRDNAEIVAAVAEIEAITGGAAQLSVSLGLGIWADHKSAAGPHLPAFWKRVLFSVIAVYPSLLILLAVTGPVIGELPRQLQTFIVVVLLSTVLTWPVMPYLGKLLQPWLSKK